jgi:hypothetical protein
MDHWENGKLSAASNSHAIGEKIGIPSNDFNVTLDTKRFRFSIDYSSKDSDCHKNKSNLFELKYQLCLQFNL